MPPAPEPASESILLQDEATKSLFVFCDGRQSFAVPPESVSEVINRLVPTTVPFVPDWVEGIISARGEIIPVLDLERFFRLPADDTRGRSRLIVFSVDEQAFAVWADRIIGVEPVEQPSLEPPLTSLPEALRACISAQFRREGALVLLVDLPRLLLDSRQQAKGA